MFKTTAASRPAQARRLLAAVAPAALLAALTAPAAAQGLPTGFQNPAGVLPPVTTPSVPQPGQTMTVAVTAPRAYAEWETFDVDAGNTFRILGQGPGDVFVNRVVGQRGVLSPSDINGAITGGGQFWLLNPAGIAVGRTAVFDVGGLLLSTAAAFNRSEFLKADTLSFDFGDSGGSITVGPGASLTASNGAITLAAPSVTVLGALRAPQGEIALVGAADLSITFDENLQAHTTLTIDKGSDQATAVFAGDRARFDGERVVIASAGMSDGQGAILLSSGAAADAFKLVNGEVVLFAAGNAPGASDRSVLAGGQVQAGADGPAASVRIGGDLLTPGDLSVTGGSVAALGDLSARDLAISSSGAVTTGGLTARDDIVVRAAGALSTGEIRSGQTVDGAARIDAAGAADRLAGTAPAGHDIDLRARDVLTGAAFAGASAAAGTRSDLRIALQGAGDGDQIGAGSRDLSLSAEGDVILSGPAVGRDVAIRSDEGAVTATTVQARDDVALRAADGLVSAQSVQAGVVIDGLGAGDTAGAADALAAASPLSTGATPLAGSDIDVGAAATRIADAAAPSDVREALTPAGDGSSFSGPRRIGDPLLDLRRSAGGDLTLSGPAVGLDIALQAGGTIRTGALTARDDVVLRGTTLAVGALAAGRSLDGLAPVDALGVGDALAGAAPIVVEGRSFTTLEGHDVDLRAQSMTISSAQARVGDLGSDLRLQGSATVSLGDASVGGDLLLDSDGATAGALAAGRDAAVRARTGSLTLGSVDAGDDVVLRAATTLDVSGGLTARGVVESEPAAAGAPVGAADLLFGAAPTGLGDGPGFDLTGSTVDVVSGTGEARLAGPVAAATDARVRAGGALTTARVTAGRDILLDGAGVRTRGDLDAGRDLALRARTAGVQVEGDAVRAGDDLVIRSAVGVEGAAAFRSGAAPGIDARGAADRLVEAEGRFGVDGLTFDLTGHDLDVVAGGAVTLDGALVAEGRLDGPPSLSDVRVQGPGAVRIGDAEAGRDLLLLAGTGVDGALQAGGLSAGRDVAARSARGALTVGSAAAGDDVVLRARDELTVAGRLTAAGGEEAGAEQAGDLIGADAVTFRGEAYAQAGGADVDLRSMSGSVRVGGPVQVQRDARVQAAGAAGSVRLADVTAGRDVLLDGAGVEAAALRAGRDAAVEARSGPVVAGSVLAGDDAVVRSPGAITVEGALTTGTGADSAGVGDRLATAAPAVVEGRTFDTAGGDADLVAGGEMQVRGPVAAGLGTLDGDARLLAGGGLEVAAAAAGRDILLDGARTATAAVSAGALTAGRDLAVRSGLGALSLASVAAGDDVVLRARDAISVAGSVSTSGGPDSESGGPSGSADLIYAAAPTVLAGPLTLADGAHVDVGSELGGVTVSGPVTAASDARFQAASGGLVLAAVAAGRDVLADGAGVRLGSVTAGGDVALRSRTGEVRMGSVQAGDDLVVRSAAAVAGSADLRAGAGADRVGAGDRLATLGEGGPFQLDGRAFDLAGGDIDVQAGAGLSLDGDARAEATGSDVRLQAAGEVRLGGLRASRDVLLLGGIGPAAAASVGQVQAGRDVAVRWDRGGLALVSVEAGDDLVLRVSGTLTAGALTTTGPGDADGAGDLVFAASPMALAGLLLTSDGAHIDVRTGGALAVNGRTLAAGDARLQSGGALDTLDVQAGRDVLLDGGGRVSAGDLSARDIAVRSRRDGVRTGAVSAGDDLALRAVTDVTVSGVARTGLSNGADPFGLADRLVAAAEAGPSVVEGRAFDLTGGDLDIVAGGVVRLEAPASSVGSEADIRLLTQDGLVASDLTAGRDVLADARLGVAAGSVTAGRDVGLRSREGGLTIEAAAAGDDLVLRAANDIRVDGALIARGEAAAGPDQAGDLLFAADPTRLSGVFAMDDGAHVDLRGAAGVRAASPVTASGDVRVQAGQIGLVDASAGRDVLVDGSAVDGDDWTAGRDVAVRARTGTVRIGGAEAGDDVAIRAFDEVVAPAGLRAGGAEALGAADRLVAPSEAGPFVVEGRSFGLEGGDLDVVAGSSLNVLLTASAASDVRLAAGGSMGLGAVRAEGGDVLLDAARNGSAFLMAGAVEAAGDVGVRSGGGSLTIGSASAGDDVVVRAAGPLRVEGGLTTRGAREVVGSADILFAPNPTRTAGALSLTDGGHVDLRSMGDGVVVIGPTVAAADARFQTDRTAGTDVLVGAVTAGRDILVDGSDVGTGGLVAGRDMALRARSGEVALLSATAGDDLVVRAAQGVTASGDLRAGSGADASGAADRMIGADESGAIVIDAAPIRVAYSDLGGAGAVDVATAGAASVAGAAVAGGDVRFSTTGALSLGGATAGRDVMLDARGASGLVRLGGPASAAGGLFVRGADLQAAGLSAGRDVVLFATGSQVRIGGAATPASGFVLDAAEIAGVRAVSLNVFGGAADMEVAGLALPADTPVLRLYTSGDVAVTGAVTGAPGSALVIGAAETQAASPPPGAPAGLLQDLAPERASFAFGGAPSVGPVGTGFTPATIRITGSIGGSSAEAPPFRLVSLNADEIRIFPAEDPSLTSLGGFEAALDARPDLDPASLPAYFGPVRTQIAAQTLAVRASGRVLQRNLDPGQTQGGGLRIGRLVVDTLTPGGTVPSRLSLFGGLAPDPALGLTSDVVLSGPQAAPLVQEQSFLGVRFDAPPGTYRVNGCEIGTGGGCLAIRAEPQLPPIDAITSLGDLLDRFAAVDDEPVTNTGVELNWFARDEAEEEEQ